MHATLRTTVLRSWKTSYAIVPSRTFSLSQIATGDHHMPLRRILRNRCLSEFQPLQGPCTLCGLCASQDFSTSPAAFKRRKTAEERKHKIIEYSPKALKKKSDRIVEVWKNMTVRELADALEKDIDDVFEAMIYIDNSLYYDEPHKAIDNIKVLQEIVKKCGQRSTLVAAPEKHSHHAQVKDAVRRGPDPPELLKPRPAVVTVMGHVDHGKTTLLDALRHTHVVDTEFGGITQHVGAFSVKLEEIGGSVTFLDTPGHAAFSAMRSRGAHVTDLVVLVVAADDGVMQQTVESIQHAREANVPIIVAINKIDKPEADIERTKKMLLAQGLQLEDFGGDVQAVPVSALKGTGLHELLEALHLQADLLGLRASPVGPVEGVVIDSCVHPARGKLATALVQRGTLRKGSYLVAGLAWAKVRALADDRGQTLQEAAPSMPVEVLGWRELPNAGDVIIEVESEKRAREVVTWRQHNKLAEKAEQDAQVIQTKVEQHLKEYKSQLEEKRRLGRMRLRRKGPRQKEIMDDPNAPPKFSFIIKGDVDGTVEAILDVFDSYHSNDCHLDMLAYGVGNITENDIKLAEPFKGTVYGFNVQVSPEVMKLAQKHGVAIKQHNIIYRLIDDVKNEISKRLPLRDVEELLGEAHILQEFVVTEGKSKIPVAGCRCTKGVLKKDALFRIIRGEEVVYTGKAVSLRHLKSEVDSIKKDVECGVRLQGPVQFQPGDVLQCYELKQVAAEADWDPGF